MSSSGGDDRGRAEGSVNPPGPVLVFGATGQQGGAVARALRSRGWPVRALVRDPGGAKARDLAASGVDLVGGDFDDQDAMREAMSGAYGVFSVQPSSGQGAAYGVTDEQEMRWGKVVAELASNCAVQHLVYSSVNAAGQGATGLGHFDSKTQIEAFIRKLAIPSTIVRPAAFMELMMLPGMGLDQGAFHFFLRSDQVGQMIAVEDIGEIVARIFTDPATFAGETLEIAGDALTGDEIGEALSRATGRPITYRRFPDVVLEQNDFLARLARLIDDGRLAGHADIPRLRRTFGPLTRFGRWLEGSGRPLLEGAMRADTAVIALR